MSEEKKMFTFLPPVFPGAIEWPGSPLGVSNVITGIKGRTELNDKDVDGKAGLLDKLLGSLDKHRAGHKGEEVFEHDVIIHGIRVRAVTNSRHLYDFWVGNWFSPEEWQKASGEPAEEVPRVMVYAFGGVAGEAIAAYYSRQHNTIIFFNSSYYGQLKSWVLGAVGRILGEEYGIHSIHGACAAMDGKGVLYIAPTGTGKSTASYGIMGGENTRFHSDDWVYVRYTYKTRSGLPVSPIAIKSDGQEARGYQVYRWLEANGHKHGAKVIARDLAGNQLNLTVGDLDITSPVEAYAYISEKVFYLRTNIVENFPETVFPLLTSKLENVPDVTPEFLAANRSSLDSLWETIRSRPEFKAAFGSDSREETQGKLARLFAFANARAMLDITNVFGPEEVFANPGEPVRLTTVMLLERDFEQDQVVNALSLHQFMARLLIGETPVHTREIAYNAYRAVDDGKEMAYIRQLEQELKGRDLNPQLYEIYQARKDVPPTLYQEFELFRVMHQAASCYELNTILQKDKKVANKRAAVGQTIKLITKILQDKPAELALDINNYCEFVS